MLLAPNEQSSLSLLLSLVPTETALSLLFLAFLQLVGQRWRPRVLVLEGTEDGEGGRLWWFSEADGETRPKGSLPLEVVCLYSACVWNATELIMSIVV